MKLSSTYLNLYTWRMHIKKSLSTELQLSIILEIIFAADTQATQKDSWYMLINVTDDHRKITGNKLFLVGIEDDFRLCSKLYRTLEIGLLE